MTDIFKPGDRVRIIEPAAPDTRAALRGPSDTEGQA